ncbi:uncharacterized protein LOC113084796 [Carassius auratus]|uniref:Uncharacterized protein LOC113084796 n=1 Tax=Carassius auratus TaxID=7957 RepID=A0A6P6NQW7_CARAU|nr:uncharacterized protein LOC113084796 [Carassius auratus]
MHVTTTSQDVVQQTLVTVTQSCEDGKLFFSNTVTSLIGSVGNEITIQCAAKTPQVGVYLYKQEGANLATRGKREFQGEQNRLLQQSRRTVKMASLVRYSFLLICICLRSTSWAKSMLEVTSLIGSVGNEIIIQCATAKTPQDGVFLYKQEGASQNKKEVFYYYKDGTLTPKSEWCRDNVRVTGTFPNFNVTILNLKATDIGLYWCEFNFEEKMSISTVTWLWIEESVDKNTNKTGEADGKDDEQECSGDLHHLGKIFLIVSAVMMLLCITGFIFVILKVKRFWRKKYRPSNPPSVSVNEEIFRSNLDS